MSFIPTFDGKVPRWTLVLWLLVAWFAVHSSGASAQVCHGADLRVRELGDRPLRARVAVFAATYDTGGYAGNYEGLYAAFEYRAPWYSAELLLPAYRLDRTQGIEYGLGDMVATVRGTLVRARADVVSLGVELPLMLPTGDSERDLGMGHVMPMPNVYAEVALRRVRVHAQVGYGRMIGPMKVPDPHHAGSGPMKSRSPLVNPMNMSELEHALSVGVRAGRVVDLHVRWWGAVPVADAMGVLRQAAGAGVTANLSWVDIMVELQRSIAGDAFAWKPMVQLGMNL